MGFTLLPNLLFALFIGSLVDRYHRKKWTMTVLFLLAVVFALSSFGVDQTMPETYYYVLFFVIGTLFYSFQISRMATTKEMLPNNQMTTFNAQSHILDKLLSIGTPTLGGALVFYFSPSFSFLILSTIIAFSAISTLQPLFASIQEGWRAFIKNKPLVWLTVSTVFVNVPEGIIGAFLSIACAMNSISLRSQ